MDHAAKCNEKVFALLLPGACVAEAKLIAERIRSEVDAHPLPHNGEKVQYTVSVGVTEFAPDDERERVIQRANQSLEAAQSAGGNRTMALPADCVVPMSVAKK
jgi:diguanylate cyclase (GGDEF)-like protein